MAKICVFFRLYLFFWFYLSKKYIDFGHKSGIRRIKLKKFVHFSCKSGKLVFKLKMTITQIGKTIELEKNLIIFLRIWTERTVDGLPNAE